MDTEKQGQCRRDNKRLTESGDDGSEQLLMMPTESLSGELLSGSEHRTPGWFLDMNIRLVLPTHTDTEALLYPCCTCMHEVKMIQNFFTTADLANTGLWYATTCVV